MMNCMTRPLIYWRSSLFFNFPSPLSQKYNKVTRLYSTITGNGVNSETGRLCFPGWFGNTDIFWICPCRILADRIHRQSEEENT